MNMILNAFLLILGFVLLVQGAKVFVNSSVDIAKRLKISPLVIGLTVVAMGTSAPEVVIGVLAALGGNTEIAVANVVGSNIFNTVFIIGFCAAIFPFAVRMSDVSRDFWVCLAATLVLLVMVIVFNDSIPRLGSFALIAAFVAYLIVVVRHALKNKHAETTEDPPESSEKIKPMWTSFLLLLVGFALLVGAGQLTVSSAVNIASIFGVTERVIGLTIIAMGTSLPEVVTAIIACRKGEGEFVVGFIIGSSIFNIMLVLGLSGVIAPLSIGNGVLVDMIVLTVGTLVFFLFAKTGGRISRFEGVIMVVLFSGYITWAVMT